MSTLKVSMHSDVLTALELVKEEVDKEAKRVYSAGGDALKAGKIQPAEEAIAYSKKLDEFVKKIHALGEDWKLLEAQIDAATPEVKEIVQLPTKIVKPHAGFKQKPGGKKAPKTTFEVIFADGTKITNLKANIVLAKAIEHIGAESVAKLDVKVDREPFVHNDIKIYKNPSSVVSINGGWYVSTHSSTQAKIKLLEKIATKLGVKLTTKIVEN